MVEGEVARGLGLTRDRDVDGALDGRRVEAELLRGAAFPVRVASREVRLRGEEVGEEEEGGRGEGEAVGSEAVRRDMTKSPGWVLSRGW